MLYLVYCDPQNRHHIAKLLAAKGMGGGVSAGHKSHFALISRLYLLGP